MKCVTSAPAFSVAVKAVWWWPFRWNGLPPRNSGHDHRYDLTTLGPAEQAIIAAADTFFIATAYQSTLDIASGVDVSHRGGNPGFVRIDDPQTLTIPDFPGNCQFNTFGNLELNPCAGLLFLDFDRGDLLYLTGTAEVLWEGDPISRYPGAERLMRFYLHQGHYVQGSLPRGWSVPEVSSFLDTTGPWLT